MREKGLKYVSTPIRLMEYILGNKSISKYMGEISPCAQVTSINDVNQPSLTDTQCSIRPDRCNIMGCNCCSFQSLYRVLSIKDR
jgi:hypothetical protein